MHLPAKRISNRHALTNRFYTATVWDPRAIRTNTPTSTSHLIRSLRAPMCLSITILYIMSIIKHSPKQFFSPSYGTRSVLFQLCIFDKQLFAGNRASAIEIRLVPSSVSLLVQYNERITHASIHVHEYASRMETRYRLDENHDLGRKAPTPVPILRNAQFY